MAHWRAYLWVNACGHLDTSRSEDNEIWQSCIQVYHTQSKNCGRKQESHDIITGRRRPDNTAQKARNWKENQGREPAYSMSIKQREAKAGQRQAGRPSAETTQSKRAEPSMEMTALQIYRPRARQGWTCPGLLLSDKNMAFGVRGQGF